MPYRQVFELQEPRLVHGSDIVDQSVNLGVKGMPGSLTSELFHNTLDVTGKTLTITGAAELDTLTLKKGGGSLKLEGGPSLDHAYIAFYPNSQGLSTRWGWMGFGTAGSTQMRIKNEQSGGGLYLETTNGILTLDVGTSVVEIVGAVGSSNSVLEFPEGYVLYADNVGSGSDNSRLWLDSPNGGEVVIGPRGASNTLGNFRVRANTFIYDWEDGAGDAGSITWPHGIIYDFSADSSTGEAFGVWPDTSSTLAVTLNTPTNVSVTVVVWCWFRLDNATDQIFVALSALIGGSRLHNPALQELDLTTDTDATGSSSTSHQHPLGIYHSESHSGNTSAASASHTHSHAHAMSAQWNTLNYMSWRSYTPSGSSISVVAEGGHGGVSGSVTYDDGAMFAMVVVN